MRDHTHPDDDVAEFLSTLSSSGMLAEIEVSIDASDRSLSLHVVYKFNALTANDGKPLVLAIVNTPFRLREVRAIGATLRDPDSEDGSISASTGAILVEPVVSDWNAINLQLDLTWPSKLTESASERFLTLPEALPRVISANAPGKIVAPIPGFTVRLAPNAESCWAGGIVEGAWVSSTGRMEMLQCLFVRPGTDVIELASPANLTAGNRVSLTHEAASIVDRRGFAEFETLYAGLASRLQEFFAVPLTLHNVAATDHERPDARGPGASTILPFRAVSPRDEMDMEKAQYISELIELLALAWWGAGIRIVGRFKDGVHVGIAMCTALLLLQERVNLPMDADGITMRSAARARASGRDELAWSGVLGAALFKTIRFELDKQDALRALTRKWWGKEVPDFEFIRWCIELGVEVPTELNTLSL